ncbi:histidine phosphatase family protein [uncultured Vibrio sp.]|uniref:histidine phosphatase family protein n=1 Tax=uncultured Vibrio sp. TaxID=114054 RepID=UPI0009162E24|nr:histidine phosphatase family protein [uncultured Vibrio sp.]OIQ26278.1 MAG: hypothetical protein BM561_00500 [Vibrio sp. MedPE-SWchi]
MTEETNNKCYSVYLLRHGKTLGEPSLNGVTDVAVADSVQQSIANALMKESLGYSTIISSPLRRCRELAEALTLNTPGLAYSIDEGFMEMDFGDFDGQSFDSLRPHWSLLDSFWQDPSTNTLPNAESLEACYQRVTKAWSRTVNDLNNDTIIVCHGGTIRLILAYILKLDYTNAAWYSALNIANQSLTHITIFEDYKESPHIQTIGKPLV